MSLIRHSLLLSIAVALAACSTAPPQPPAVVTPTPPVVTPPVVTPPVVPPVVQPVEPAPPAATLRPVTFADLPGWGADDLRQAWPAFIASCGPLLKKADWQEPCKVARDVDAADGKAIRTFFEAFFVPHQVINPDGSERGMVTGYYEPLLHGARKRGGKYQTPLYRVPADMLTIDMSSVYPDLKGMRLRGRVVGNKVLPYASRAELEQSHALVGSELLWVNDPIDAFFLQIQGSGRVQLADAKETVRLAYADQNGHPYKSIGRYLIAKGELTLAQASAQGIKAWVAAHPERQQELLNANPSYVFFKEEKLTDPNIGPKGALGVPLTTQRSIAIDPQFIPLGAPVFLETTHPNSTRTLQRLMLAQDTGGAIKGAVRADFFWGFGDEAGEEAGRMKQSGAMWVLLPRALASNSERAAK